VIDAYRGLREEVDRISARLEAIHGSQILCRQGCCDCCRNLTVWPVEFFSIVEEMKATGEAKPEFDMDAPCGFLKGGLCQIYPFRPLICRTHGLPIAFENNDAEPPEMSVSFCPKNFKDWAEKELSFGPDNTLNIDLLNQELGQIHAAFLDESKDENLSPYTRIELKEILGFL
jgi:Fe-S-cluster containining protein